jgi:hypothetical protein
MRRPSATLEALGRSPLVKAGRAHPIRIERVPFVSAGTKPSVFFARASSRRAGIGCAGRKDLRSLGKHNTHRLCDSTHVGGLNVTAAESQRHFRLRSHSVEVAARGKYNSVTTNPPSNCANSLMVPRRLRLVKCREASGCPNSYEQIAVSLERSAHEMAFISDD